jgi:mannose-1-phosphate guanylyltransferase
MRTVVFMADESIGSRAMDGALYAVVLAGGSGTRFWPRSRAALPKQFLRLGGERTLIQATVDRLEGLVPPSRVLVVTGEKHRSLVSSQLPGIARVLAEPSPRDTAAAIGWATWTVAREGGDDAILAVLPSDHAIHPAEKLRGCLSRAAERAREGAIITFGIPPTLPSEAYGYIRKGAELAPGIFKVEAFEEKPKRKIAEGYLAGKKHAWNSGMFVFSARTLRAELAKNLPKTAAALDRIIQGKDFLEEWDGLQKISIDYAVLEKASRIEMLETDFTWSDVGSWDAAGELFSSKDEGGNAVDQARFVGFDAKRCVVAGDGRLVGIVGLEDVIVVQQGDAVLVCKRERAEDVKKLVQELEKRGLKDVT